MRNSSKLLVATATVALVGAGGSPFTATSQFSTAAEAATNAGSVPPSISGATILDVTTTYNDTSGQLQSVTITTDEWLDQTAGVVSVKVNGGMAQPCAEPVQTNGGAETGADEGLPDYTTIVCDMTDVAKVTSLQFVING